MTPVGTALRSVLVEPAQIVGVAEIAHLLEVAKPTVCAWRERHADFPKPVASLRSGPLYLWPEVKAWRTAHVSRNNL